MGWFMNHLSALIWVTLLAASYNGAFLDDADKMDPEYPELIHKVLRRPDLDLVGL